MGPYTVNIMYNGLRTKTITNLSKREAMNCFYAHFDNFDGCAQVVLGDKVFRAGQAIRHFGKRRAPAMVIMPQEKRKAV